MKKIFLTAIFAAVTLTGCSDAYDIHQPGFVTEESEVFRTPEDIGKGVRYIYSLFPGETEIRFDSFFTDELGIGLNNAGQGVNDGSYTFLLQAGNSQVQTIWARYYGAVNRLNRIEHRILEMEEDLQVKIANETSAEVIAELEGELSELNEYLAEVYALRAYCHYKLFAYFTPDYTNPNGLSIIKFDFLQTDDYNRFEERSTVSEIVAFIQEDIDKAKNLGGITNVGGTGFASNEMLSAIQVKMYSMLQTADAYDKMEVAFNELTSKSLADVGTFLAMFTESADFADGSEGIFKLNRVVTDNIDNQGVQSGVASAWYADRIAGGTYMEMGRSLFNELDKLDPSAQGTVNSVPRNDVRYSLSVHSSSIVAPGYASMDDVEYRAKDILYIGKYSGMEPNRPLMNSLWVFRYTDMLLSLAEKRAFEGDLEGVESIINEIRINRNISSDGTAVSMPTDFSTQQAAYARILEERRVEFAFEGYRYLDMKRLGVRAGSPGFVRDPMDCSSTGACQLEPTDLRLTMPIPRSEMVSNPNMVQNPGY